jgi:N-acetylmuramic acid 6-phosphate etherase
MPRRSDWESLPTEAVHPESANLHRRSARSVLALLSREDLRVAAAVRSEAARIERASLALARALARGGRVFFVGAGTSGRLGVLEAAECPPTFGTDPGSIVALIAGGPRAVFRSVEGAEDREEQGRSLLRARRLSQKDAVVGISASSVTPFVRGALAFARRRGASTVLVTCGSRPRGTASVVVSPGIGPEVLAGSTRMKAGTATKLVLNQITLLAMIRLGKVHGPYMVDVRPGSRKLRDRARRIVEALAGADRKTAATLLGRARGDVKLAVVMGALGLSSAQARRHLESKKRDLDAALPARSGSRGRRLGG